jgi:hypothetical protein
MATTTMTTRGRERGRGRMVLALAGVAALLAVGAGTGTAASAADPPPSGQLVSVRIGNDGTFDRVVFEFGGTVAPTVSISGPVVNTGSVPADPSDQPIPVPGTHVVTVVMHDAVATWNDGTYTGPTSLNSPASPNIALVSQTGDFEGVLTWVIGTRSATTPRVAVLADPVRVVVDIPHPSTVATAPATPSSVVSASPGFTG